MREILLVSRCFYPAGVSLHIWLSAFAVAAHAAVAAGILLHGATRRCVLFAAGVLAASGALASLAMIGVEAVVFHFAEWLCLAAYCILLGAFAWTARAIRTASARFSRVGVSALLATAALTYLFPFGNIPRIVELKSQTLANLEGTNLLGGVPGALLVTEFADFECPPCAGQDEVMQKLWQEYPDRIRYNFRHLPLTKIHPYAQAAAVASQCAARQGRFWETKRLFFANQDRLAEFLSRPVLPTIPPNDIPVYLDCMQSQAALPEVLADLREAQDLRLHGTPSILVGNTLIAGSIRYPRLEAIVKQELGNAPLSGTEVLKTKTRTTCGASPAAGTCAE
jgi:hypothetical protein